MKSRTSALVLGLVGAVGAWGCGNVVTVASGGSGGSGTSSVTVSSTTAGSTTASSSATTSTSGTVTCLACGGTDNCPVPVGDCAIATCGQGCCGSTDLAAGTPCSTSGGHRCDGNGQCVGCLTAADCPSAASACESPTCEGGMCGIVNAAIGTACSDNGGKLCNGNGACVVCVTTSDCAPSATSCALISCNGNACAVENAVAGTPCAENGGKVCDGTGKCSP